VVGLMPRSAIDALLSYDFRPHGAIRGFCARFGVTPATVYHWRRKLGLHVKKPRVPDLSGVDFSRYGSTIAFCRLHGISRFQLWYHTRKLSAR
jgi:hypothetical protein